MIIDIYSFQLLFNYVYCSNNVDENTSYHYYENNSIHIINLLTSMVIFPYS